VTQAQGTHATVSPSMFYQYPPRAGKQGKKPEQAFQDAVFRSPRYAGQRVGVWLPLRAGGVAASEL